MPNIGQFVLSDAARFSSEVSTPSINTGHAHRTRRNIPLWMHMPQAEVHACSSLQLQVPDVDIACDSGWDELTGHTNIVATKSEREKPQRRITNQHTLMNIPYGTRQAKSVQALLVLVGSFRHMTAVQ